MNLSQLTQLYAQTAGAQSTSPDSRRAEKQTKAYLQKKQDKLNKIRKSVAPFPEDRRGLKAGGAGSGCHGSNCGRKSGSLSQSTGRIQWEVPSNYRGFVNRPDVEFKVIPANRLEPSESFVPVILDKAHLRRLYNRSVKGTKPLTPVLVKKEGKDYVVLDGHHRSRVGMIVDGAVAAFVVSSDKARSAYNRAGSRGVKIKAGGPGSGPTAPCPQCGPGKGGGSSSEDKGYSFAPGVNWVTGTGFAKTGRQRASNAMIKVDYFAKKNGFKKLSSENAGRTGIGLTKTHITRYQDEEGHQLAVVYDPAVHQVYVKLTAPSKLQQELALVKDRRDVTKMLREIYTRGKKPRLTTLKDDDPQLETVEENKKLNKRPQLCTICHPGVAPGRNITGQALRRRFYGAYTRSKKIRRSL